MSEIPNIDNENSGNKEKTPNPNLWKKGVSGNPNGRPKLPEEIRDMQKAALEKAITILHDKINDERYMNKLDPNDLLKFMETTFDRFGLPKVTKNEHSGNDGTPLIIKWENV